MSNSRSTTQRWVLALTSAASLMVALDQLVVATALSTIRRDLNASIETLEWTVNSYSLSFAVLLMTAAALVMPLALAILSAAYPVERRGRAIGLFPALTGLAVVGGPVVGGAITEGLAWQWIFWINIPIGVVVIPLVLRKVAESRGPSRRVDVGGVLLSAGAALGLVWGLVRGNSAGWSSAEVLTTLTTGIVLVVALVAWERRVAEPMLPMGLFRIRAFAAGNASTFLLYGSLFSTVFFLSQYLQVSFGYSPLEAGLRTLPWTLALFVVAPVSGALADRIGARPLVVIGLTLQAAGFAWIALNAGQGRSYASSVGALVVAGCGVSMAMPAVQSAVLSSVPPAAMGTASGANNMVRQLGGAFGIAVLAATFAANGSYASSIAFNAGVAPALGVAAGMSALGALTGLLAPGRGRPPQSGVPAERVLVGRGEGVGRAAA